VTAEVTHNRPQAAPLTWQEQEQSNAAVNTPRPTRRVGGPKQSPVRARRLAIAVWTAASYLASRTPIALERTVRFCFNGVCGSDQCRTDSDCGKGSACACVGDSDATNGGNECVPAQCRVNSDCGTDGVCAPSFSDSCGLRVDGYHCRSVADTCNDSGDCCKNSPSCLFQPASGHWSCQPMPECIAG